MHYSLASLALSLSRHTLTSLAHMPFVRLRSRVAAVSQNATHVHELIYFTVCDIF